MMKTTLKLCILLLACFSFVACSNDSLDDALDFSVASFSPAAAVPGSEITIIGSNFPTDLGQIDLCLVKIS